MGWEDPFVENPPSPVSFRPRFKWLLIESKLGWRGNYAVYGIIRLGTSSGELNFMGLRALHSRKLTPGKVKELEIVAFKGEQNGEKAWKMGLIWLVFSSPPCSGRRAVISRSHHLSFATWNYIGILSHGTVRPPFFCKWRSKPEKLFNQQQAFQVLKYYFILSLKSNLSVRWHPFILSISSFHSSFWMEPLTQMSS